MTATLRLKALHICVIVARVAYRCYINSAPLDPYVASDLGTSSAVAVRAGPGLSFQPGGSLPASDPRTVVELIGAAPVHVPRVPVTVQDVCVLLPSQLLHRACLQVGLSARHGSDYLDARQDGETGKGPEHRLGSCQEDVLVRVADKMARGSPAKKKGRMGFGLPGNPPFAKGYTVRERVPAETL